MPRKGEIIFKRKDGRWEARYKKGIGEDGRTLYGYCYGSTYREAKEKVELKKQLLISGQPLTSRGKRKPLGLYCDEWLLVSKNKVKESTMAKYDAAINNHIKPYFGGCLPEMISTELTAGFADHLINSEHLSAKTAKDIAVILKSVLKYIASIQKGFEVIEVVIPKYSAKEIRVLTHEEQQQLIDYLLADMDSCKFGVLFALMTGLRIGEVCALKVGNISLPEKTVTVRETVQRVKNLDGDGAKTKVIFTNPKSDKSARVVPLTNTAFELCRDKVSRYAPDAFLLTGSNSKYIEPRTLQYRIKQYGRDCGIEDMHFHVLRHTFATRCVEVGFEIKSLSEVLGHSTPRITLERYVQSSIEFKRQNMEKREAIGL